MTQTSRIMVAPQIIFLDVTPAYQKFWPTYPIVLQSDHSPIEDILKIGSLPKTQKHMFQIWDTHSLSCTQFMEKQLFGFAFSYAGCPCVVHNHLCFETSWHDIRSGRKGDEIPHSSFVLGSVSKMVNAVQNHIDG